MPSEARRRGSRRGYLAVDALIALAIIALAAAAAVALAAEAAARIAQARDRLTSARIAETLYEDLYAGRRPDGQQAGVIEGRGWRYETTSAATAETPSSARLARIVVERRFGGALTVEAALPPAPAVDAAATPSSN